MATRTSGSNRKKRQGPGVAKACDRVSRHAKAPSAVASASVLYMAATLRGWVKLMRYNKITPQFIRHQVLIALHDYSNERAR